MVGRGKTPVTWARAASATPESSEKAPQYIIDIMARMQAMEEHFADNHALAPQRQPIIQPIIQPVVQPVLEPVVVPQIPIVAPATEQES